MRKFLQNKLWRDKAVEKMEKQGSRIHWRVLDDDAFAAQLRLKLLEEAEEVASAKNRHEMISELADLFEVIEPLLRQIPLQKAKLSKSNWPSKKNAAAFQGKSLLKYQNIR